MPFDVTGLATVLTRDWTVGDADLSVMLSDKPASTGMHHTGNV
jgi:hypothetical protein